MNQAVLLKVVTAIAISLLWLGCQAGETDPAQAEREKAVAAVQSFSMALKTELGRGMKQGGPVSAIEICNDKAPAIANSVGNENGLSIGRVSERNRNPANAPNDWQSSVLASFEARKAEGEDPAGLIWSEITEQGEFRFMRAIPTAPLCLACHGELISAEVQAKLDELYPDDNATGFRQGDLRGAFVVTRQLPQAE
jgi:hypothetical protein